MRVDVAKFFIKSNLNNIWSCFSLQRVNSAFLIKGGFVTVYSSHKELFVTFKPFRGEKVKPSFSKGE